MFKLHGATQGHVSSIDYSFGNDVLFGAPVDSCTVRSSCLASESCLFKMASENNSHIASCVDSDVPYPNSYDLEMCCSFTEICNNDLDDTGDGLVDCASPTCHPSALTGGVPQECTNNTQTTAYCLANPGDCSGPGGLPYYCSYGVQDDPSVQPQGFCCPAGTFAVQDAFFGTWSCQDTTECGIGSFDACNFDFESQQEDWLMSVYYGDIGDWCVSQYPDFYDPITDSDSRSAACCNISQYGQTDYYVADRNVKVFG